MQASELVSENMDLLVLPDIYNKVTEKLEDPNSSNDAIAAVLRIDPVLTGRLLKLVNSAFYGLPRQVADISQAVGMVGRTELGHMVLGTAVAGLKIKINDDVMPLKAFWRHSIYTAVVARLLARQLPDLRDPEEVFVAGLLHDLGRLVIAHTMPDKLIEANKLVDFDHFTSPQAEREVLGFDHTEVGEALFTMWKLPEMLVKSCRYHHHPEAAGDMQQAVWLVYLAHELAHFRDETGSDLPVSNLLSGIDGWGATGLNSEQIQHVMDVADIQFELVFAIMS